MKNIESQTLMYQWCYTFDFLRSFSEEIESNPNQSIQDFYSKWHKKCGFENPGIYPIANTLGVYLSGLFILLNCPKETLFDELPEIEFAKLDESKWGKCEIAQWNTKKEKTLKEFVRRMRNSVSHFNVTVQRENNSNYLIFRDENPHDKNEIFEIKYQAEELHKFLFRFARSVLFKDW